MQAFFYVTIIDLKLLLSFLIKKSLQWNFISNVYKVNTLFFETNIPSHHTRHKILARTRSHAFSSWHERIVALALMFSRNRLLLLRNSLLYFFSFYQMISISHLLSNLLLHRILLTKSWVLSLVCWYLSLGS